ncbi:MAG: hypothetical protein H7066_22710 [Cytophagaceae bacterium]|nr:hypothetical protein [Gemmatimonadaceae bacterium]
MLPLLLSACKLDDLESALEPETGTGQVYSLTTVNDKTVPATLTQGNVTFEIQKGALTLAADSTFILSVVIRQAASGTSQRTVSTQRGKYRQPAQPTTAILLSSSTDTLTIFSGTYSSTAVDLADLTVPLGDRLRFIRP